VRDDKAGLRDTRVDKHKEEGKKDVVVENTFLNFEWKADFRSR
jgi:hypothetical protein